jgi:hypothetical protein
MYHGAEVAGFSRAVASQPVVELVISGWESSMTTPCGADPEVPDPISKPPPVTFVPAGQVAMG